MTLHEIQQEYEKAILGDQRALKLFYLELRKFSEKHPNALNISVIHNYADFFLHPVIDRNTICVGLFKRLVGFADAQDLHKLIVTELHFDAFAEDFIVLLHKFCPMKSWTQMDMAVLRRKFLLLTLLGTNQTEFCLASRLEAEIPKSIWKDKASFDSTQTPHRIPIYPRKLRINASLEENKSFYEIELNNSVKLTAAIHHTI